ncbi:MAG: hypothetical protein HC846_08115 [Blastocatellia bacterium]|nr:hypothetical protein [Blastocatellia bacterium]
MIKFVKLFALLAVFSIGVFAQNSKSKIVGKTFEADNIPSEIKPFVPEGYEAISATTGDLNMDAIADAILIVKKPNEKETSDVVDNPTKRPLLVLLGEGKGKYKLAGRNDNVVLCVDCGGIFGDPFEGVTIKNGFFSVEHYGGSNWRWTKIITFKYSPTDKSWLLTRVGSDSYHTGDPNKVEKSVKTAKNFGKVLFEKYDSYKDEF